MRLWLACAAIVVICGGAAAKPRQVDSATLKVLSGPTLGQQHILLDGLEDAPEAGWLVPLSCELLGSGRGWLICKAETPDLRPEAVNNAAVMLARTYLYDFGGSAPTLDAPVHTRLTLKLSPPKLVLDPTGAVMTDWKQVVLTRRPTMDDVARFYPDRAIRLEVGAKVRVRCKVLEDLSFGCADAAVERMDIEDPALSAAFEQAALKIVSRFISKPSLADGRPAAGIWVEAKLVFAIPN